MFKKKKAIQKKAIQIGYFNHTIKMTYTLKIVENILFGFLNKTPH